MRRNFKVLLLVVGVICLGSLLSFGWLCWQEIAEPSLASESGRESVLTRSASQKFQDVQPDTPVILPGDFAFHDNFQHEWWNFFANVADERGRHYGIQWSVLRIANHASSPTGWRNPQLYISYVSISNADSHVDEQRIARGGIGQAGMDNRPFRVWIDNWSWRSLGRTPFPGQLKLGSDGFAIDLSINTTGPLVLPGEQGYVKKDDSLPIATYQFAAPFLSVNGTLRLENSSEINVKGNAWLSKEWGSGLLSSQQKGWDWFVVHLDENQTLVLYRMRQEKHSPYVMGYLVNREGHYVALNDRQIVLEPLLHHILENGRTIPLEWELRVPQFGVNVRLSPLNSQQWLPFVVPYWQGALETIGSHQSTGFMQLMGY